MTLTRDDLTDLERWGYDDGFLTLEEIAEARRRSAQEDAMAAGPRPASVPSHGLSERGRRQLAELAGTAALDGEYAADLPRPAVVAGIGPGSGPKAPAQESRSASSGEGKVAERFDADQVCAWLLELGHKVEPADLTPELRAAAYAYLDGYRGDFEWMTEQRRRQERYRTLFDTSLKGVLNVWRADLLRERERAARLQAEAAASQADPAAVDVHAIPAGGYAVRKGEDVVTFYRVSHGKLGTRWEGYSFLRQVIGGGHDRYLGRVGPGARYAGERRADLAAIAADLDGACRLYGQELGTCGRCGQLLTDPTSRALGMGPQCRRRPW